jgi:hypothetical protein
MHPIEIPPVLRTDEFLKRKYSIVKGSELPKQGYFFIKNASKLKEFSYTGYIELLDKKINDINPEDFYQVSEVVNILSEYRVYVINKKIYAIAYYNGNPCIFPDINLIQKANLIYSIQPDYPNSYTMDVMINEKGTSIIEIHPLFSCGIYQTVIGEDFLYGYKDSLDYIINHNTKIS